ncbi:unnamed protein product [Alopecurus aequalis]
MEAADEERPLLHQIPPELYLDGDSRHTSDGTVDADRKPAVKTSTGNWRACFFVLGIEFSECLAFFAISKNLVTYLTSVLHESNVDAARNVSTWIGTSFFTPLVGAFLADTYWGRYKTIVVFLSIYTVGMLVLTVSATLPWMLQPSNHGRVAVYLGLYLTALGNGGIKPCTSAFGADQFDISDPAERVRKGSFFNWYYFSINVGSLVSTTVLVWVQDKVGWGVGFAVPLVLMSLGFMVFLAGRRVYRYKRPGESPMKRVSQVVVAAARNCHAALELTLPDDCSALHQLPPPSELTALKIHHPTRFLDKAAIVPPPTSDKKGQWRLCTVSQVEEVKKLLRLCPVWASLVVFFMATSQTRRWHGEWRMAMDNRVGPFTVPPASMVGFDVFATLVLIPVYDAVLVPLARRATGEDRGLSQPQRIGVGLALSALAMAYERKRRLAAGAMSIVWQAPAYTMLGAGEVFAAIGMLELFYDRAPDGIRSLCTALAQLSVAAGNYLNSAVLGAVASAGWIPEDLDEGHLDYFFWVMATLSALNVLQFVLCSSVAMRSLSMLLAGFVPPLQLMWIHPVIEKYIYQENLGEFQGFSARVFYVF